MGQDDAVQPGHALAQEGIRRNVSNVFIVIAAAVHHPGPALALQEDALALAHIQHRHPALVHHGLRPADAHSQQKTNDAAAKKHDGLFLPHE